MMRWFLTGLVLCFVVPFGAALAQSDSSQFTVTFWGGADTTPPPTPTITSATPITDTQIDVVWGAVVDDFALAGYVVFRDGLPVATTTLTNYSDTGLTPSTTYSYTVRAFDGARNYSTSSAPVATTTLDTPPPPPVATSTPSDGSGGSGTIARPVVDNLTITPGVSTTSITLALAMPGRVEIRWGQTTAYEMGASIGSVYRRTHSLLITDLTPRTIYYYEIVVTTPSGVAQVVDAGSFTTHGVSSVIAPANVEYLTATVRDADVVLTWQLPTAVEDAMVRIVRNYYGFPVFPSDGAVIYQGVGEQFVDSSALLTRSPVYYTAFVYDRDGNVSSGAIAMAFVVTPPTDSGSPSGVGIAPDLPDGSLTTEPTSSTTVADTSTPPVIVPALSDMYLIQGDRTYTFADSDIQLESDQPFVISIPKDAVSGAFKSIIVTIVDPTDTRKEFSFLLRINQDQTAYEAVLAPVRVSGDSTISVTIYNYTTLKIASYKTPITFTLPVSSGLSSGVGLGLWWPWILLGVLLLFLFWWLLGRLMTAREDNTSRS